VDDNSSGDGVIATTKARVAELQGRAKRTLVWQVWDRLLEIEFVDRSVALAGKAFVSFFPLVIVVAAFMPATIRRAILTALTTRLGVRGHALSLAKEAFASTDDIRKATGILGLLLTFFFASSFTTALQRIYLRAWRREGSGKVGEYSRGLGWLAGFLVYMTLIGALREAVGNGVGIALWVVLSLALTTAWWWFTAWFLLLGQVRWRVLLPTGVITCIAMIGYGIAATVWMPNVVTKNQAQFGFFGIALALVTWFSGAAICLLVGACAGPVLAEDPGPVGRWIRGASPDLLVPGAPPSLPPPAREMRLRDAFRAAEDDVPES
jgi:membrane protein